MCTLLNNETMSSPIIICLQLEEKAQHYFTSQRTAYFPKHINYLEAHLTLFHALPATTPIINKTIEAVCKRKEMELQVIGLTNTGNGVAYSVESAALQAMHQYMQQQFDELLVGKDRREIWPHITIQNKVTAFKALQLYEYLSIDFKPFPIRATGISTWLYRNGPWEKLKDFLFRGE
jgi:2'-5' RNA ligase